MATVTYNQDATTVADVHFPKHAHHFKVRSELTQLVEQDVIDSEEADEIYEKWIADRK